jgi:hypothetical protein
MRSGFGEEPTTRVIPTEAQRSGGIPQENQSGAQSPDKMNRVLLFFGMAVCLAFSGCTTLRTEMPNKKRAPWRAITVDGITLRYPSELQLETESDVVSTQLNFAKQDRSLQIPLRIYKSNIYTNHLTPKAILEDQLRGFRHHYRSEGWSYTETPVHELIAGEPCRGRRIVFTTQNTEFVHWFLTAKVKGKNIFIFTVCRKANEEQMLALLRTITSRIQ